MFSHAHPATATPRREPPRETAGHYDALPRPAYPDASRIVVDADRRTRQLADAMLRLNAEDPDGCTEITLDREGFSPYEQQTLGPAARKLADGLFVRHLTADLPEFTDDELIAIALDKVAGLVDIGQIHATLRADWRFSNATIARIWTVLRTRIAANIARSPIPVSS